LSRDQVGAAPAWTWNTNEVTEQSGKSFRLARWRGTKPDVIEFSSAAPAELSVVAAGPMQVEARFEPPTPWLVGEPIRVSAALMSPLTSAPVTEWSGVAGTEAVGKWNGGGDTVSLAFDPRAVGVQGMVIAPASGDAAKGIVTMFVSGARWTRTYGTQTVVSPLRTSLFTADRLFEGEKFFIPVESALGDRSFSLKLHASSDLVVMPDLLTFEHGRTKQFVSLQSRGVSPSWFRRVFGGLGATLRRPPQAISAGIAFDFQSPDGLTRPSAGSITIQLRSYPWWTYWVVATILIAIPILLITWRAIGRPFPNLFLSQCDLAGRAVKGGDLIELRQYRKRVRLGRWGLVNVTVLRPFVGKDILVNVGSGARLLKASNNYRSDSAVSMTTTTLEPGDILAAEKGGSSTSYKFG
jgi:hypothetical protein